MGNLTRSHSLIGTFVLLMVLSAVLVPVWAAEVTISFSYWGSQEEHAIWTEVLDAFEKAHPGIKVERLYTPSSYENKLRVMIASGTAPDVMSWEDKRALPLVPSNCFMDLNKFIDQDPTFRRDMYYPITLEDFQFKGQQWALPWDFVTTSLIYNKDMFDEAGMSYPTASWDDPHWNWDSFVSVAKKLTLDRDGDGTPEQWGFANGYSWSRWRLWMWQNGGLDWEPTGTRSLLNSDATIAALQFMADLNTVHRISPTDSGISRLGGDEKMLSERKVAMKNAAPYNLPAYRANLTFGWDLAAFARGPVRNASPIIPDGLAISATTKHPEEAWQLVKFVTGFPGQSIMAERGYRISPRRDVIGKFVSPATPQREEVWLEAIAHGILTNYTTQWTNIETNTLAPVLRRLLNGEIDARRAVAEVEPKISLLLAEAETRFSK